MGFEAKKTNRLRSADFIGTYFSGSVLDIGCGPDPVVSHAVPFDTEHGDANRILDYLKPESFDCVHSSHCLEHMRDVPSALLQWWALVKPGGAMVLVVPDEDLYEQGYWPSFFNVDHKATFRLDKRETWSPVSYDLCRLVETLPDGEIVDIRIQDDGYDRSLLRIIPGWRGKAQRRAQRVRRFAFRALRFFLFRILRFNRARLEPMLDSAERRLGKPAAQTDGDAVAQIQAVLRKRSSTGKIGHVRDAGAGRE